MFIKQSKATEQRIKILILNETIGGILESFKFIPKEFKNSI